MPFPGVSLVFLLVLAGCGRPELQPALERNHIPFLSETTMVMNDGVELPFSVWRPKGKPMAVVLALHGFNDYRNAFGSVGPFLAGHGIVTYAFDQRGFGETPHRGIWAGGGRMREDAAATARLLAAAHPGLPLYLLGESMGAAVLMSMTGNGGRCPCAGMILVAPAVWGWKSMNPFLRSLLWVAAHTAPTSTVTGRKLKVTPSDNDEMLRALSRDPLIIKETRIDAIYGLTDLMDEAADAAPNLNGFPVLVLYGERDEIIPRGPVCRMLKMRSGHADTTWTTAIYPDGYHMLTRDLQADVVLEDIADWIADPSSSLPSGLEVSAEEGNSPRLCR